MDNLSRLDTAGDGAVITRKELAASLGVTTKTLSKYIARGIVPPPVDPSAGKHVFLVGTVRAWLRRRERETLREAKSAA